MSKLSRNKKASKVQLNNSLDDFQNEPISAREPEDRTGAAEAVPSVELPAVAGGDRLPDCPFCGKDFRVAKNGSARQAHVKACAQKKGVATDKLLDILSLERRQAEERRALGLHPLPLLTSDRRRTETQPVRVRQPRPKQTQQTEESAESGADPDLVLALALSISSATATEQGIEEQLPCTAEASCVSSSSSMLPSTARPTMWLPQPSSALQPASKKVRKKGTCEAATLLQSRSREERQRLIDERVASLICPEEDLSLAEEARCWGSCRTASRVLADQNSPTKYWAMASRQDCLRSSDLVTSKLRSFVDAPKSSSEIPTANSRLKTAEISLPTAVANREGDSFKQLSKCWLRLLLSGQHADLDLVCKEEKTVACHRLVLAVRCPSLLGQVIQEKSSSSCRDYVIMSDYDSLVVRVLLEYLYGGVFNIGQLSEGRQLGQLQQLAACHHLTALQECLASVEVTFVRDGEEVRNDSRGFFGEEAPTEDDADAGDNLLPTATQNLAALAGILDVDDICTAADEQKDPIKERQDGEEWDEFCMALTQKSRDRTDQNSSGISSDGEEEFCSGEDRNNKSPESLCSDLYKVVEQDPRDVDVAHRDDSYSGPEEADDQDLRLELSQSGGGEPRCDQQFDLSRSASPDMFEESDNEAESVPGQGNKESCSLAVQVKRKSWLLTPPETSAKRRKTTPTEVHYESFDGELPTPEKIPVSRSNMKSPVKDCEAPVEEWIDLTQSSPSSLSPPPFSPPPPAAAASSPPSCSRPASLTPESPASVSLNLPLSPPPASAALFSLLPAAASPPSQPSASLATTPTSSRLPRTGLKGAGTTNVRERRSGGGIIEDLVQIRDQLLENINEEENLERLLGKEVSVTDLLQTGIGKVVRQLRGAKGRTGELAGQLMRSWKLLVITYEGPQPVVGKHLSPVTKAHRRDWKGTLSKNRKQGGRAACGSPTTTPPSGGVQNCLASPHNGSIVEKTRALQSSVGSPLAERIPQLSPHADEHSSPEQEPAGSCVEDADNWNDSRLWRSENEPIGAEERLLVTPVNKRLMLPADTPLCTPLPDYEKFLTPELRAELKRFGLKAVPRRKAVAFLKYIYDETHPLVASATPTTTSCQVRPQAHSASETNKSKKGTDSKKINASKRNNGKKLGHSAAPPVRRKQSATILLEGPEETGVREEDELAGRLDSSQSSQESRMSENPEETCFQDTEDDEELAASQVPSEENLHERLKSFIQSRPSLHQTVLLYEPIWLNQLIRDVKEAGIKCKNAQIVDFLDQECITFRAETNRNNRQKKSPKKKTTK